MSKKGRIIQGFWDCPYCNSKRIAGGERECPSCGKARGTDTKFYMDGKHYVEPEKAKTISRNPDWLCSFCETLNDDRNSHCCSCGASKSDSQKNYFKMRAEKEAKEREIRELEIEEERKREEYNSPTYNSEKVADYYSEENSFFNKFKNFFKNNLLAIILSLLGVLGLVFIISLCMPKEDVLTVTELNWSRIITIQKEKTVQEDDWSLPSGGRLLYTKREIHHYEQVLDHYETVTETKTRQVVTGYEDYVSGYRDLGNGYFEEIISSRPIYGTETYTDTYEKPVYRDEPVYKTKYYYEIDKWFNERTVETEGHNKNDIYWGEVILGEKEREGNRKEYFSFDCYNSKNEKHTYSLDYATWTDINVDDVLNVKIHLFNRIEILDQNGNLITEAVDN